MKSEFWRDYVVVSGFDVGKKGNPSHHSIFAIVDDEITQIQSLVQIHQKFLDRWDYIRQIEYINACVEYFGIERMYYDNTRGEFEERELSRRHCIPIILGAHTGVKTKGKFELATSFAKLVEQSRIKLLDDDRFISQICCITSDLQAPNTPLGHGDSFISIILAVGVFFDFYNRDRKKGFADLGNAQEVLNKENTRKNEIINKISCKICGGVLFENLEEGGIKCLKCFTVW